MRVPALRHLRPLPLVGLALSLIASCSPRGFNQRTAPASGVRNDTQTSTMEAECKLNDKRMNSVLAPVYASYWKNTRVDLYRAIAKAYADVKPECLGYYAGARYSTDKDGFGSTLFNKIARLGSRFPELLTDPGIVFRLDEFISFATPQAAAEPDPWKMRTAFAEHLESTQ
ncbi:MAG: hypothetical protein IOD12_17185, partial [Silvanigrellales bacterium]|nr:hypothetical protein [Silvanigrellales bacterium]